MRRNSGPSFRSSGAYTSPGTPEYGDELPKTWSSERVALGASSSRRHVSMALSNGRAVPSKWDDAERWITSPIGGFNNAAAHAHRRPKSKSGPLAPMGLVYSPTMPRNFMANSPLTTGVLLPDALSLHYEAAHSNSLYAQDNGTPITSTGTRMTLPAISDMLSQDEKVDGTEDDDEAPAAVPVLRRDMATQMSPQGSSKGSLSFSTLHTNSGKDDIRDVQVDKGTTRQHHLPAPASNLTHSHSLSKLQREESKIAAWESLQKAKAEAAVRKLEMKLEKKRSASMDKISNKLIAVQTKAQRMRDSLSSVSDHPSTSRKSISTSMYRKFCSICYCFICNKR